MAQKAGLDNLPPEPIRHRAIEESLISKLKSSMANKKQERADKWLSEESTKKK